MTEDDRIRITLERAMLDKRVSCGALSRLIGRNAAYIQQYLKRGTPRRLEEGDRRIIARFLAIDERLLGAVPETADRQRLATVPRLALGASAGVGTLDQDEREAGHMAFDQRWLRALSTNPEGLSIITVDGDSMAPTLNHGDDIMVDRNDSLSRLRDGIYVIRFDDVLMVKRLALSPRRGVVSVRSDNPAYPSWNDVVLDDVTLIGRVVWVGHRLR